MEMTVTEALGELRLIEKKMQKKRGAMLPYLTGYMDALEKNGGQEKLVADNQLSLADLAARHIEIRLAIQESNRTSKLLIKDEGTSREETVAWWLTWKREIAAGQRQHLSQCLRHIEQAKATHEQARFNAEKQRKPSDDGPQPASPDLIVFVDERKMQEELAQIEYCLEKLDTLLTLHNSTTVISVN